jgi:hypothetical protein
MSEGKVKAEKVVRHKGTNAYVVYYDDGTVEWKEAKHE